jgi:hypothetical protein
VWHLGLEGDGLACRDPMVAGCRLDREFAPKTVNDDLTRCPMLRQPTAGLEGEQQ